ncbi:hypothetical protein A1Q2_07860 [Trichosporon asahii var. asahii CBS 8904]|uniref:BTB domain-containing protein n=1 Tax=Trichosporon asahii var. asahii (strain CBS 8904) TaxID=1220162 RepID=K1VMA5_TRIAC|nr:hypothetical protein A1Q2_07860 [Trichosporon asahii var. asahii CBS 8904]
MASSPSSADSDGLSAPLATMTVDTLGSPSSPAATTNPANDQEPGGTHAILHYAFTSGDIEVMSSDDVRFRLNLSILQQHSPFFRDLADLPLPPNSTRLVPFTNASALTLEILLCALDPAKDVRPVPSVIVFNQLCGLIDAYDMSLVGHGVVAAVEMSGLDLFLKYRFACSHNPERRSTGPWNASVTITSSPREAPTQGCSRRTIQMPSIPSGKPSRTGRWEAKTASTRSAGQAAVAPLLHSAASGKTSRAKLQMLCSTP